MAKDVVDEVITLQDVAGILGCSDSTLRKHILNGKLKAGNSEKLEV
ncbi:DNA-binding protein [Clostridium botulinum]|uniref:DNA-binding protein n=2 Tax=Clostridium botulinum TaxID=1491 RepID=A0A846I6H7_CLOBO|nr:DNA-binding protein [Clostridium botulinum]EDT84992.1 hypothetical protein CBB_2368 [Clostridium botulinum Bf]EPS49573.1 hypothetical protein CFSAN002368_17295 [Clostridium botulinum A1 str. CFSAN002368]ACQ54370.1 hypothetical protein CLJ_B2300 [Clostridium botulinum Ba4 str. 657]AXG90734.1 DNA-binding protein [Clostridium botulinum]MBN3399158.1 DNA-binding protein [Clostridium botulinum]